MAAPKTRFTVEVAGKARSLVSIEQRADKSLIVLVKHAEGYEAPSGRLVPIKEQRYSVHNSDASELITIKQTFLTEGAGLHEGVQLTRAAADDGFALLYTARRGSLTGSNHTCNSRPRDTLIGLPALRPERSTLVYSVVISNIGRVLEFEDSQYAAIGIDAGRYRVSLIYGYVNMPALPQWDFRHLMTSAIRIDKGEVDFRVEALPAFGGEDIAAMHDGQVGGLVVKMIDRLHASYGAEFMRAIGQHTIGITPRPV